MPNASEHLLPFSCKSIVCGVKKYNLPWPDTIHPAAIELEMIRHGGRWKARNGDMVGEGLAHHYQQFQRIVWPEKVWHKWNRLLLEQFCKYRMVGVVAPASSGKTREASDFALTHYYAFPDCTTVLVSSTEREMLEMRIWGEMKRSHKLARERCDWLPGQLIESRQRIVTDTRDEYSEGRDFRNGIAGVSCKKGGSYVGLGSLAGCKNKYLLHIADELQFMPQAFIDAIANLNKNRGFKGIGLGNPKDITDCLGKFCEPSAETGGWEGGIDQAGGTKTWRTKWPEGICVQLVGSDSPNMIAPEGTPDPYPFLIGREAIATDIAFYGKDSLQFSMMDEGRFPRGQGLRRVITRQMCLKFQAMEEPIWENEKRTRIGFLDAAYGAIGGDRCVFGELQVGKDVNGTQICALIGTMVVPVVGNSTELPEDQIANFVRTQCAARQIIPENFFFDSTGRGSLMAAFARLWSPNVQPIEFGGRPTERPISNEQHAITCRQYYLNFVSELWFTVRLVIMSGQFRGMTEEVMNEGCMREWKLVGKNKTQVETKAEMKLKMARSPDCFVAGTKIRTVVGDKSIEDVEIGDLVVTPFGCSPVVAIHQSDVQELTHAAFSDGSELTGKGKHKIFTWDKGWTRLDALVLPNACESVHNLPLWHYANGLFTRATSIGFKQMVDTIHATAKERTLRRSDFYTESFGLMPMAQFLTECPFTTKMGIGKTITSPTSCWWDTQITCPTTCVNDSRTPQNWNGTVDSCAKQLRLLKCGTDPKRVLDGIRLTASGLGKADHRHQCRDRAFAVGSYLIAYSPIEPVPISRNSAPRCVETDFTTGNTPPFEIATSAAGNLHSINSAIRSIAPVVVQRLRLLESRRVYNLTLLEDNAYYANGVLVANCFDALVCGVEGARRRGFVVNRLTGPNVVKRSDVWKKNLTARMDKVRQSHELTYS